MPPKKAMKPPAGQDASSSSERAPFTLRSAEFANEGNNVDGDANMHLRDASSTRPGSSRRARNRTSNASDSTSSSSSLPVNGLENDVINTSTTSSSASTSLSFGPASLPLTSASPAPLFRPNLRQKDIIAEQLGNPFLSEPHAPSTLSHAFLRRDIYPAFDATGRRIGLEHIRSQLQPEVHGHYRKHVHEYDNVRGAPLPIPSQNPLSPAPASYAPPIRDSGVAEQVHSESSTQPVAGPSTATNGILFGGAPPLGRTPHEVLGLPPNAPLNLWSLLDPEEEGDKPQYNYHILVKLAILGNKGQRATLQEILKAIRDRFPYYRDLGHSEAIAFNNSIRHLLSLLAAFVREPKPVTEPGKGAYWRVDFSRGEGNKRERKRNKKSQSKKKPGDTQEKSSRKTLRGAMSRFHPGRSPSSANIGSLSPPTQCTSRESSVIERGLSHSRQGSSTSTATISNAHGEDDFYSRLDPALVSTGSWQGSSASAQPPPSSEDLCYQRPTSVGPQRDRVGIARNASYPRGESVSVGGSCGRASTHSPNLYQLEVDQGVREHREQSHSLYRSPRSEAGSLAMNGYALTEAHSPFGHQNSLAAHAHGSGSRPTSESSEVSTPYEFSMAQSLPTYVQPTSNLGQVLSDSSSSTSLLHTTINYSSVFTPESNIMALPRAESTQSYEIPEDTDRTDSIDALLSIASTPGPILGDPRTVVQGGPQRTTRRGHAGEPYTRHPTFQTNRKEHVGETPATSEIPTVIQQAIRRSPRTPRTRRR